MLTPQENFSPYRGPMEPRSVSFPSAQINGWLTPAACVQPATWLRSLIELAHTCPLGMVIPIGSPEVDTMTARSYAELLKTAWTSISPRELTSHTPVEVVRQSVYSDAVRV